MYSAYKFEHTDRVPTHIFLSFSSKNHASPQNITFWVCHIHVYTAAGTSSSQFGFVNGVNLMPGLTPLTCSFNIPSALPCASPPPTPVTYYSVFLLNQSSRAYDRTKDASYLMGIDPATGSPTNSLLGTYLGSYSDYKVDVVNSMSGSTLMWSAIYIR